MNKNIEEYIKGFRDGYDASLNIKSNNFDKIMVYGYTLEQILKLIEKEEISKIEKPKLSTREKAIEILSNKVFSHSFDPIEAANRWLNAFEALGLIKFKEEKSVVTMRIDEVHPFNAPVKIKDAIEALEKEGYTVTKNG